jgi:glycosyltransferase involved in cell wall biosynthesis
MKEKPNHTLRIAFVSANAWTMYNFRKEVLESFLNNGYEVVIIAEEDDCASLLTGMGCLFVSVKVNNRSLSPAGDIRFFLQLKNIYKKYRPDFIFHYVIKPNIYGTLAARLLHIPSIAVITGLGHAFNKHNMLTAFIKALYRFSLRFAYRVWCLNVDDARFFSDNKIVPHDKITILPGEGVNTGHFKKSHDLIPGKEYFTFLMSSRLLKTKGIIEYANATLILKEKNLHFQSYLLGSVEKHPDAIPGEQINAWNQQNGLQYLGFTGDVRPYLASADCFIYPSYYNEGVPRSLMEACSMELPVITTDNTGCRELIEDGENGYLCEKQDPENLAVQMERMINTSVESRKRMGLKGRQIVQEKHPVEKVISFYVGVLNDYFENK